MMASNKKESNCCQFYLTKKKRYCRFMPKPNATYCPEHSCVMGVVEDRKRIPCPLNPNHNCYEDELQKHLKKCNVTKRRQAIEKLPYYVKDVNKGVKGVGVSNTVSTLGSVKDLTSERLGTMIEKIGRLYSEVVKSTEKLYLEHSRIKEEIVGNLNEDLTKAFGDQAVLRKEMLQQASLVGQLENLGFLSNGYHYVELGAGKGKLSHWIHKASEDCDNSFLLVERSSVRYKVDPCHKREEGKQRNFQRIKIDIQDLSLGKVPGIQDKDSLVIVGKHLCGGATDLGIQCAVNSLHSSPSVPSPQHTSPLKSETTVSPPHACTMTVSNTSEIRCPEYEASAVKSEEDSTKTDLSNSEPSLRSEGRAEISSGDKNTEEKREVQRDKESDREPPSKVLRLQDKEQATCKLQGIMIALCCHHRCTWDVYVGQEFMKRHGIDEQEFDLLTRLSSWATCARTRIRGKTSTKKSMDNSGVADDKEDEASIPTMADHGSGKSGEITGEKEEEDVEEDHGVEDLIGADSGDGVHLRERLSVVEREAIGRKAKRIIDQGRIEYLQSKNMECCLREYISDDITPENVVLIATYSS